VITSHESLTTAAWLEVVVDGGAEGARVVVLGEIDMTTGAQVADAIDTALEPMPPTLVLDLAGVGFLDSTGVRLVHATGQRTAAAGVAFSVVRPPAGAGRALDLCGAGDFATLVDPSAHRAGRFTRAG
jgi:anti-anti-sigma factor